MRTGNARAVRSGKAHRFADHGALGTVYVKMKDGESALTAFERMAQCLVLETDRLPSSTSISATNRFSSP
jgi:hypothetical protein